MKPITTQRGLERIGFFSDAVFAVVLVLLVSHILVPETYIPADDLPDALGDAAPELVGAAVAFGAIGLLWLQHHRFLGLLEQSDEAFVWLNLLFLACIALLSYPAAVLTKHLDASVAILFFAGAMTVTGLVWTALCWYATVRTGLVDRSGEGGVALRRSLAIPLVFTLSAPLAPASFEVRSAVISLAIVFWLVALPAAWITLAPADRT